MDTDLRFYVFYTPGQIICHGAFGDADFNLTHNKVKKSYPSMSYSVFDDFDEYTKYVDNFYNQSFE